MSQKPSLQWDAPISVNQHIGIAKWFHEDAPLCWIGSECADGIDTQRFLAAFEAGNLEEISAHQKMGEQMLCVIAGTDRANHKRGILALLESQSGIMNFDQLVRLKELDAPPVCYRREVPLEVRTQLDELTSSKFVWSHILTSLWPFSRR